MPFERDLFEGILGTFYEERLFCPASLDGVHSFGDQSARRIASLTRFGQRDVWIGAEAHALLLPGKSKL